VAAISACVVRQVSAQEASNSTGAIPAASNIVWRADMAVQRTLQASRANMSTTGEMLLRAGNWWGGTGVIVFAAVLWLGGRAMRRTMLSRIGLRGAEGIAIASALSGITKGLAGRSRPFFAPGEPWHWDFNHGWSDARFFSMPSGHTTATVAFAVAVTIAAWRAHRANGAIFGAVLLISAVGVGVARMYADQHWLSDVVAALVLGTATSLALARVHERRPAVGYHRVMLGAAGSPDTDTQ